MTESRKVSESRTRCAVEYVRMRVVAEDDLGTTWERDESDPYLQDATPGEIRFRVAMNRIKARRT